jgi:hypothetical protein
LSYHWLEQPNVIPLSPGDRHWPLFRQTMISGQARGPMLSGAELAALTIEAGGILHTTGILRGSPVFAGSTLWPDLGVRLRRADRPGSLSHYPGNGRCLPALAASLRRVWVSNCGALHPMRESDGCRTLCGSPHEKEPATRPDCPDCPDCGPKRGQSAAGATGSSSCL